MNNEVQITPQMKEDMMEWKEKVISLGYKWLWNDNTQVAIGSLPDNVSLDNAQRGFGYGNPNRYVLAERPQTAPCNGGVGKPMTIPFSLACYFWVRSEDYKYPNFGDTTYCIIYPAVCQPIENCLVSELERNANGKHTLPFTTQRTSHPDYLFPDKFEKIKRCLQTYDYYASLPTDMHPMEKYLKMIKFDDTVWNRKGLEFSSNLLTRKLYLKANAMYTSDEISGAEWAKLMDI